MKRYINSFAITKYICFCLVVMIHAPFSGTLGALLTAVARAAVPFFFCLSGYFYKIGNYELVIKKIKLYTVLYIILSICWTLTYSIIYHSDLFSELAKYANLSFSIKNIFSFFVLGVSFGNEYLWYLHAIALVLVFSLIIERFNLERIYDLWPIGLFVIFLCVYGCNILNCRTIPNIYYRNGYIEGFLCFSIGRKLNEQIKYKHLLPKREFAYLLLTMGIIGTIIENCVFGGKEIYLSSMILMMGLIWMSIATNITIQVSNVKVVNSIIDGLFLYLFHPVIILALQIIQVCTNVYLGNYFVIFVIFFTTICSYLKQYVCNPETNLSKPFGKSVYSDR